MKKILGMMFQGKPKKSIKFVAATFVLVLVVVAIPITVRAGQNSHFSGTGADAGFFSANPAGCVCEDQTSECIFTDVFVSASEGKNQSPPGNGGLFSQATIFISQFDCMEQMTVLAIDCFVSLADSDFEVSQQLDSAMLSATLPCFDELAWVQVDVDVDLNWTGAGDLSRSNFHSHTSFPGCTINSRFNGTSRPAEATGNVSVDTTNFTPDPSNFADIFSTKSGDLFIDCE